MMMCGANVIAMMKSSTVVLNINFETDLPEFQPSFATDQLWPSGKLIKLSVQKTSPENAD